MLVKEIIETKSTFLTDVVKKNLESAVTSILSDRGDVRLFQKLEAIEWVATDDMPEFELHQIEYRDKCVDFNIIARSRGLYDFDKDDAINPYSGVSVTKHNTHYKRGSEILPSAVVYSVSFDVDALVFDKTGKYDDAQDCLYDEDHSIDAFNEFKEFLIDKLEIGYAEIESYFGHQDDY